MVFVFHRRYLFFCLEFDFYREYKENRYAVIIKTIILKNK